MVLSYDEQTERWDRIAEGLQVLARQVRNLDPDEPAGDTDALGQRLTGLTEDLDWLGTSSASRQEAGA